MTTICIYHDNCHDGITALWIVKRFYPDAETYPGRYDEPLDLEGLAGKDVVMVDFSKKRPEMEDLIEAAKSLVVLDHHVTARSELDGLRNCECVFDLDRSGAGITWDYFYPWQDRYPLINHVEDRDLWRFALPKTREIHAACGLEPLTLEARERLMTTSIDELASVGGTVLRYHNELVEQATKYRPMRTVAGYRVPFVFCPVVAILSDVGQVLAKGQPFACVATDKGDGNVLVSLRSLDTGVDVSTIAKMFGGGGHKHAAGFTAPTSCFVAPG